MSTPHQYAHLPGGAAHWSARLHLHRRAWLIAAVMVAALTAALPRPRPPRPRSPASPRSVPIRSPRHAPAAAHATEVEPDSFAWGSTW